MINRLKKGLLVATAMVVMSCGSVAAMAAEEPTEGDVAETQVIVDEGEIVDAEDASVGVHDGKVMLNEKNFPDEYFRQRLALEDKDGDGYLNVEDISDLYLDMEISIKFPDYTKIKSLEGIEYLTSLSRLYCRGLDLGKLDVSKNTELTVLCCEDNNISTLTIGKKEYLYELRCENNLLSELDIEECPKLTFLSCYNTNIKEVDLRDSKVETLNALAVSYDVVDKIYLNPEVDDIVEILLYVDSFDGCLKFDKISGLDLSMITDENYEKSTNTVKVNIDDCYYHEEIINYPYLYNVKADGMSLRVIFNELVETPSVTTTYHTHIQTYGDTQGTKKNGEMAGTSGESKRLENIWIDVEGNDNLGVQYSTHCQTYGWMPWSCDGEVNGTSGESKRLEAIKIQLTGTDKDKYDVYYRVHAQSYGWLGWAKNGEPSGTAGYGKRLEGIQIVVVRKGDAAPGLNYAGVDGSASKYSDEPYVAKSSEAIVIPGDVNTPIVSYKTHVQTFGWQKWVTNGAMSGTQGKSKRLEGINIKITNCPYEGDIVYTTHVQKYGWKDGKPEDVSRASWKKNGQMSGTNGEAKRLEAICIDLTGEMGEKYDIYYRVHAQSFGWLGWAKNGEESGTAGYAKRLEGIQIVLVPKGGAAPANNYGGLTSVKTEAYISK